MQASQFSIDSYLGSELPQASAAWEALREGEGRGCRGSRLVTRSLVIKLAPWLVLLFWTAFSFAVFGD